MPTTHALAYDDVSRSAAMLSERLDDAVIKFRRQLDELVSSFQGSRPKPSTFQELTTGLKAASSAVALSALVAALEAVDVARATVEHEGRLYRFKGIMPKQWLTAFGLATVQRRYYAVDDGSGGVVPLDAHCGMTDRFILLSA